MALGIAGTLVHQVRITMVAIRRVHSAQKGGSIQAGEKMMKLHVRHVQLGNIRIAVALMGHGFVRTVLLVSNNHLRAQRLLLCVQLVQLD